MVSSERKMNLAPDIENSTREQREEYIKRTFWCRSDCDNCGICQVYGGTDPLIIYEQYIEGEKSFLEIAEKYR